jgi:hypothetical protein
MDDAGEDDEGFSSCFAYIFSPHYHPLSLLPGMPPMDDAALAEMMKALGSMPGMGGGDGKGGPNDCPTQ